VVVAGITAAAVEAVASTAVVVADRMAAVVVEDTVAAVGAITNQKFD